MPYIAKLCPLDAQQTMPYRHNIFSRYIRPVTPQQVVYLHNAAGRAVFNGQHSVIRLASQRPEHRLKAVIALRRRVGKHLTDSTVCKAALNARIAYPAVWKLIAKQRPREKFAYGIPWANIRFPALTALACAYKLPQQPFKARTQLRLKLRRARSKQLRLPLRIVNRQVMLQLESAYSAGYFHSLPIQLCN